ncbi:MAG: penicillin-binding protein 2, partial [Gammaproteobacteria bacterium RBG_16_57_12]
MSDRNAIKDHAREAAIFTGRVTTAFGIVLVLLGALVARMVYLQIFSHEHFTTLSEQNRVSLVPEVPTRGLIFDRNGALLVQNMPAYSLTLVPERIQDMDAVLADLAGIVEITDADLARFKKELKNTRRFKPVTLRYRLSEEEVARLAMNRHLFQGVDIDARLLRYYPFGELAVHALGYVGRVSEEDLQGPDGAKYENIMYIGKSGVEKFYEELLRGEEGYQQVETNAKGRLIRELERIPSKPGKHIYLNLDINMQTIAEAALGEENGAVVAIEPNTGEVLVFASRPGFDPNQFVTGIDAKSFDALNKSPNQPLFNRALRGRYPPGSTLKPFVGLAALETGERSPEQALFCGGSYRLPGVDRKFRDWKKEGHGYTDFNRAIIESCDVYFYDVGKDMNIDVLHDFLVQFGFANLTGIDIPGEAAGIIPSTHWKRKNLGEPWYLGESLSASIGQGYNVATPLQLAHAVGILAVRGKIVRPKMLGRAVDVLTKAEER